MAASGDLPEFFGFARVGVEQFAVQRFFYDVVGQV
jgi:hypothetical protein